jgi:hypothetical protein
MQSASIHSARDRELKEQEVQSIQCPSPVFSMSWQRQGSKRISVFLSEQHPDLAGACNHFILQQDSAAIAQLS